ncbi:type I 3-dehydroquinate dehydratase [Desulfitobacterium sp. Sab5]|uniref:type I 3-dehydroquinate dehydratase n=1 Tax=Desulfitobacterium nosdiversum TaxID=3375356 RepID=UPI003CE7A2F7
MESKKIGEGNQPLICTPLVGKEQEDILRELENVLQKQPDLIEWRADFFAEIANTDQVLSIAQKIKGRAGDTPIIFTIRSVREGGQPISLTDREVLNLIKAVCRNTGIEYVDYELSYPEESFKELRHISAESNTKIIASYHNFNFTPKMEILINKIKDAQNLKADVAKIAVMAESLQDVLNVLDVTLEAKNTLRIPLISMAMGEYGSITRMIGGVFGSAVTFAVGESSSAPGQIPIDELKSVLSIIQKSVNQK